MRIYDRTGNCIGCGCFMYNGLALCEVCDPSEPAEVYLRKQDEGTLNACWVLCAKDDPDAILFTPGEGSY